MHILSPQLFSKWGELGVPFSQDQEFYCEPEKVLERLNCRRAVVLSMGYLFTSEWFARLDDVAADPDKFVATENDFVAEIVENLPEKLIGFFSINPLSDRADEEFKRCADSGKFSGLKFHLPACGLQFDNPEHFELIKQTIDKCAERDLVVLIHLDGFQGEFGETESLKFWSEICQPHEDLKMIVAHLGSSGINRRSQQLLETFHALRETDKEFSKLQIYFDLSGAVISSEIEGREPTSKEMATVLRDLMRKIGLDRFLPATDYPVPLGDLQTELRETLKLNEEEIESLCGNVAEFWK